MSRFLVAAAFVASLVPASLAGTASARPAFATPVQAAPAAHEMTGVRARVRHALAAERAENLARFHAYAQAGVFPSNVYGSTELNVWRDQDGHYCAAANLVRKSGHADLAAKVAGDNDFLRLADVEDGPVMDWMLTSGFTQDELVLIQRPFMPVADRPVPAPTRPVPVDPALRTAETARLRGVYAKIEQQLARDTDRSLDAAVDRVMSHPELVAQLLAPAPAPALRTRA